MKTKEEQITPIAELLPEGLSEAAVNEIAHLVNTVIKEQVEEKVHQLESKVTGFIRLKVDDLKDQALQDLKDLADILNNGPFSNFPPGYIFAKGTVLIGLNASRLEVCNFLTFVPRFAIQ